MVLSIFCFHSLSQSFRLKHFLKMYPQITCKPRALQAIMTNSKCKQNIDTIITNEHNPPTWL